MNMYVVSQLLYETRIYRTLSTIDQSRVISHNAPYIFNLTKIVNEILISRRKFNSFVEYLLNTLWNNNLFIIYSETSWTNRFNLSE